MQYHHVEKTGWDVSTLSFGCMRFANAPTAATAVRKAIEVGVNYFDVAPAYGSPAEEFLAEGIKGLRDKIILTAKSSPGNGGDQLGEYNPETGFGIRTADEARRQIERSMEILGVDHLDMYQFWACHSENVFAEGLKKGGFFEGVLKAHAEGLLDYIGITSHSESDDIIHFIQDSPYEFDMVTLPFHPIDAGRTKAIEFCAERGIGVVAMNPLGGGRLGRHTPLFNRLAADAGAENMPRAALRYVAYTPGMTTALNGITYADQAVEGAAAMDAGPLPDRGAALLHEKLTETYAAVNVDNLCAACGYCGQCPKGIVIPRVLEAFTDMRIPSSAEQAKVDLAAQIAAGQEGLDPSLCDACGRCESKCPNHIPVSRLMEAAAEAWPK